MKPDYGKTPMYLRRNKAKILEETAALEAFLKTREPPVRCGPVEMHIPHSCTTCTGAPARCPLAPHALVPLPAALLHHMHWCPCPLAPHALVPLPSCTTCTCAPALLHHMHLCLCPCRRRHLPLSQRHRTSSPLSHSCPPCLSPTPPPPACLRAADPKVKGSTSVECHLTPTHPPPACLCAADPRAVRVLSLTLPPPCLRSADPRAACV